MVQRWRDSRSGAYKRRLAALGTGKASLIALLASLWIPAIGGASDFSSKVGPSGLFTYVTHYIEDGEIVRQPIVSSAAQMTSLFPVNRSFDGVVLILYWSLINPERGKIRFDIIDAAIEYWRRQRKHLAIAIAPTGYPIRMGKDLGGGIHGATPAWVLARVKTYQAKTYIFDRSKTRKESASFPVYWDPAFVALYQEFLGALGTRYKGHPNIAFVRIGTGFLGEEHPSGSATADVIPGYTTDRWLSYARAVVSNYKIAFGATPLEYDLLWTCWIAASGRAGDKRRALEFAREIASNGIVVGHNGLRSESPDVRRNPRHGHAQCLDVLADLSKRGHAVTLEMYGPPWLPVMRDAAKIVQVVQEIRPIRVNFFGVIIPVVNRTEGSFDTSRDGAAWTIFENATRHHGLDPDSESRAQASMVRSVRRLLRN